MRNNQRLGRRFLASSSVMVGLVAFATVVITAALCADDPESDIYYVEEDWELVVNDPSENLNGPQVTCTISPSVMESGYCAFDINFHSQPEYSRGGLQLHTWDPQEPVMTGSSWREGVMSTPGEVVRWTQSMNWHDGYLTFRVRNGESTTWGHFGGHESHLMVAIPSRVSNLNGYDPNVSLDNSGVGFATNLVDSLTLVGVRFYDYNGNVIREITTPQQVHPRE